jgi:hypothetical protein
MPIKGKKKITNKNKLNQTMKVNYKTTQYWMIKIKKKKKQKRFGSTH